jgi:Spy/CpxP family protein refolding chaperone
MHWWRTRRAEACGTAAHCGEGRESHGHGAWTFGGFGFGPGGHGDFGSGPFGVRRPLRFLAFKLGLDEAQIGTLARILDELKTERAQAEVDARRALAALADAIEAPTFDAEKARQGAALRITGAERLRDAVVSALGRLHALLTPEQRTRLAYLIRTGTILL